MAHVREEGQLLFGAIELPETRTRFRGRHALIVARGADHARDLRALAPYIERTRSVLVGVDGGADAIVAEGLIADVIVGDMDSAAESTLRAGGELIVHGYPGGEAPGAPRLRALRLDHSIVPASGTSQDLAMLLAYEMSRRRRDRCLAGRITAAGNSSSRSARRSSPLASSSSR
jgi:uncharacterized membrane-anchored protein